MLSDAIRQMRACVQADVSSEAAAGLLLTLRAFEIEARNMEDRIEFLTGRPHAVLDGRLISSPAPVYEFGGVA